MTFEAENVEEKDMQTKWALEREAESPQVGSEDTRDTDDEDDDQLESALRGALSAGPIRPEETCVTVGQKDPSDAALEALSAAGAGSVVPTFRARDATAEQRLEKVARSEEPIAEVPSQLRWAALLLAAAELREASEGDVEASSAPDDKEVMMPTPLMGQEGALSPPGQMAPSAHVGAALCDAETSPCKQKELSQGEDPLQLGVPEVGPDLTWGNHEDDVPHADVIRREREYTGCWINSNMQTHESFKDSKCQVDHKVLELVSPDGSNKRKLGMIGILSSSPSLYRANAFGGAKIEDPWETMAKYKARLEQEKACDVVLPLCHLYEPQDERTCREFDFPLILSGHDHHVVDKVVADTRLLKPGQDGHKAFMVDVFWPSASSSKVPQISAQLLNVKDWDPDPDLVLLSKKSYSVLDPLRKTQLAKIPASYRPLTSFGSRGCRVSMGTYLLSRIRDAWNMSDVIGGKFLSAV